MATWIDLTPSNANKFNAENIPIGFNAAYSSIAVYKETPFVACCDNGEVIVRKGKGKIGSPYTWGKGTLLPQSTSHCSHTCLVANDQYLFVAYLEFQVLKIWRFNGSWKILSASPITDKVDKIAICLDHNTAIDNLYVAGIDSTKKAFVVICQKVNTVAAWDNTPYPIPKMLASTIFITAINQIPYLTISDYNQFTALQKSPDGRTSVWRLPLSSEPKDPTTRVFTTYGFWVTAKIADDDGFASPPESLSQYPNSCNVILADKSFDVDHDYIYLAYRGGLGECGGGEMQPYYSCLTSTIKEKPRWEGFPSTLDRGSKIPDYVSGVPRNCSANWITGAMDRNNSAYIAFCTNPSSPNRIAISIDRFVDGLYKDSVLHLSTLTFLHDRSQIDINGVSYISLAFDNANNPFITFINMQGRVLVAGYF